MSRHGRAVAARDSSRSSQTRCRHLHALLVEDNPGDVRLIREAFGESAVDSSLAICSDGEDALEYLFQRNEYESATRPDIVILDLNVPKVNGRAVLEAITDDPDLQSVPVVVLSGSKAPDDILETYRLGADGYFVKPTNPNEFIATVRRVAETIADDGPVPEGEYADLESEG